MHITRRLSVMILFSLATFLSILPAPRTGKLFWRPSYILMRSCIAPLCGIVGVGTYLSYENLTLARPSHHYAIQLMWINRQLQEHQLYITPEEKQLDTALAWAQKNPESKVILWFDSLVTTQQSIKNTESFISKKRTAETSRSANIVLKDVRALTTVQQHPEAFAPTIPVYFRADLLRAITATETVNSDKNLTFVYADLDVEPMAKSALFDRSTLHNLKKYHFVMAHKNSALGFENSFQIITYHPTLLGAIKKFVIDPNIRRAQELLIDKDNDPFFKNNSRAWQVHITGFQENVFYSYTLMYAYLYHLNNREKAPFKKDVSSSTENAKYLMATNSILYLLAAVPMPTKKVIVPESTSLERELAVNSLAH